MCVVRPSCCAARGALLQRLWGSTTAMVGSLNALVAEEENKINAVHQALHAERVELRREAERARP